MELIRTFAREHLELELNNKTQIFKSTQGVNFCGYKINEYRLKIRDKGKRKLKKKIPAQTIRLLTVTTTIRAIRTTTLAFVSYSNIISDYVFYGIYTVKY